MGNQIFNDLLRLAADNGASDVHVKSGKPALLRIEGKLQEVEMDRITEDQALDFLDTILAESFKARWEEEGQIDFGHTVGGIGRFRVAAFRQRGTVTIVFRYVKNEIPTFESLNLEAPVLTRLCKARDGIIIVSGATGSGKSSTLAAMLNWMNGHVQKHIITLEDPMEYNFPDKECVFNQREIGIDAVSYSLGLMSSLRQDPDAILIGEMRDKNTFETALAAAETGHLVMTTLHSINVHQAVIRLFEFFPPDQQEQMRRQVASSIRAIICQRLVPALEGGGRIPAVEILVGDSVSRNVIQEGNFEKLNSIMDGGGESGSHSFNKDLFRLIKAGKISKSDGLAFSPNPKALEMNLKGIFQSEGGIIG